MKISKSELKQITANHKHPLMSLFVDLITSQVYGGRDDTLDQFIRTIDDKLYKDCPTSVLDRINIRSEIYDIKAKEEKKNDKSSYELREEADRKEIADFQEAREEYMDWWFNEIRKREKRQAKRQHNKYRSNPGFTKDYIILENVTGHNFKTVTLDEICGNINKFFNKGVIHNCEIVDIAPYWYNVNPITNMFCNIKAMMLMCKPDGAERLDQFIRIPIYFENKKDMEILNGMLDQLEIPRTTDFVKLARGLINKNVQIKELNTAKDPRDRYVTSPDLLTKDRFWDVALWNDHYTGVTSPKRPNHQYKNAKRMYELKYNEMCRLPEEKLLLSKNQREDGTYIQPYGYIQHQIRDMLLHYDKYHPVFVGKKYHIRKMLKLGSKYDCVVGYIVVSDDYKTAKYYDRAEDLQSDIDYEDSEKSKSKYEKETMVAHNREDEKLEMSFNNFDMNEYEDVARCKSFGNVNAFGRSYEFPNYAGPKIRYSSVSYDVTSKDKDDNLVVKHVERQSYIEVDDAATLKGVSYMSDNYQKYVKENYSNAPKNINDIVNAYKISMKPQDFKTAGNVFCPCCLEKGEFNLVYWSLTEGYSDCRVCKCKIPNPSVIIDRDATVFADIDADRQDMVNNYYAKYGSFDPKYRNVSSTPWDLGDAKDDKDGAAFTDNVTGEETVNDGVTPEGSVGSFVDRAIRAVDNPIKFRKPHAVFKDGSKTIIFRK